MSEDQLFEIAKILDNEYNGKRGTFRATRNRSCWYLTSGVCDMASFIKIWERENKISSIEILGPDDEGYRSITQPSWQRIEKYLNTLNLK
jgi:hypothetical protein